MPNEIWVFAEQLEGKVKKITFELLSAGNEFSKKTGQPVAVLLLGSGLDEAVKSLTPFADKIYLLDNSIFKPYTSDAYSCGHRTADQRTPTFHSSGRSDFYGKRSLSKVGHGPSDRLCF